MVFLPAVQEPAEEIPAQQQQRHTGGEHGKYDFVFQGSFGSPIMQERKSYAANRSNAVQYALYQKYRSCSSDQQIMVRHPNSNYYTGALHWMSAQTICCWGEYPVKINLCSSRRFPSSTRCNTTIWRILLTASSPWQFRLRVMRL